MLLTLERRERRETSGCVLHCAEARERERDADGRAWYAPLHHSLSLYTLDSTRLGSTHAEETCGDERKEVRAMKHDDESTDGRTDGRTQWSCGALLYALHCTFEWKMMPTARVQQQMMINDNCRSKSSSLSSSTVTAPYAIHITLNARTQVRLGPARLGSAVGN